MKDEIELADVFEASIEGFDEDLDEIKNAKLALGLVDAEDEEESGIVTVDDADIRTKDGAALDKIAQSIAPARDDGEDIAE